MRFIRWLDEKFLRWQIRRARQRRAKRRAECQRLGHDPRLRPDKKVAYITPCLRCGEERVVWPDGRTT